MKPYLIGITGGSGSGKSTFIQALRKHFSEDDVCIVSQDDYYLPRDQQYTDERGEKNFDLPKSFDKRELLRDIRALLSGETVTRQEYTFNNALATPALLTFRTAPVIIVEGLFLFHYKKIAPLFDLKVYIYAKENLKVIRRIKRDQMARNYPLEDVLYKYEHHVLPAYEQYILPYKDEADIVINNNDNYEKGLAVTKAYIQSILSK